MPTTDFDYTRVKAPKDKYGEGFSLNALKKGDFEKFHPDLLGLGDISKEGRYVQALVAFCDLEGFTDFCNQVDSHLVIPEFMTRYIQWVFDYLAEELKEGAETDTIRIWGSLPFYMKFLGDGLLFMWDTQYSGGPNGIRNMVECDGGKYLCLLGASNMLGPRIADPQNPLRSGATVWRIHENKVDSPSGGGGSKGKGKKSR